MCYVAPLIGAGISSGMWRKTRSVKLWWLSLMFYGGALFGVIDHLWNRELFLISENIVSDILLGISITIITVIVWGILVAMAKTNPTLASYTNISR